MNNALWPDAHDLIGAVAPKLADLSMEVLFADIWERPGLSPRDRSLITVAALIVMARVEQLPFHLGRAVQNGVTRAEIGETVTHLAFYAGWPAAMSAAMRAKALFEETAP